MINYFQYEHTFKLESHQELDGIQIAYCIYGTPKASKTIWVCHALSGNSEVKDWWSGLFGEDRLFGNTDYRIICANVLGSCYGSTGPSVLENPQSFPQISIKDMVKAHILLADTLDVSSIDILIGASLGGQQALEWAVTEGNRITNLILVATNAVHSPFGKALNQAQRLAIEADPTFATKGGGQNGLKAARGIAMISYRSYRDFATKQADFDTKTSDYKAASYISYQGEKFKNRFNAASYYVLTQAMDSHDIARGREQMRADILQGISAKTLVIGVNSDLLFPIEEQKYLAQHIRGAELGIIHSDHGHDAFLIEYEQLENYIKDFLFNEFRSFKPTRLKRNSAIN